MLFFIQFFAYFNSYGIMRQCTILYLTYINDWPAADRQPPFRSFSSLKLPFQAIFAADFRRRGLQVIGSLLRNERKGSP